MGEDRLSDESQYSTISEMVRAADSATVFELVSECSDCGGTTLDLGNLPHKRRTSLLSKAAFSEIVSILVDKKTFTFGLHHSCTDGFLPRVGIDFTQPQGIATLLLMPECQWGRLVENGKSPRYVYEFTIGSMGSIDREIRRALRKR